MRHIPPPNLWFLVTQMRKTIPGMRSVNISGYYFICHHAGDSVVNREDPGSALPGLTVSSRGVD